MTFNPIFDLYRSANYDNSINRIEYRTYLPYIKSFQNNDVVEITINRSDSWLHMADAALVIKGSLIKKDKEASEASEAKLVLNAGAFLFDSISYELNGIEIEHVKDPGIVSLIYGYLCYNDDDTKHLSIAGWSYPFHPLLSNNSFCMRIPLSHIFGVFRDYKLAMCGRQTIKLVRSRNDMNAVLTNVADTTAEVVIDSIELLVKHVVPNDMLKMELMKSLKSDRPILIPFRKWELHEMPSLTSDGTKEIWNVKTTSSVDSPRYVVVAFQTSKKDTLMANNTLFDHIDISSIRLFLNGDYYPYERLNLNFSKGDYADAFYNYTEFASNFWNNLDKRPLLDYNAFKLRPLFVIDCSKREESIKSSTIDVKIEIEAHNGFPRNTKAYAIIIHDCIYEYLPLSEVVRKVG